MIIRSGAVSITFPNVTEEGFTSVVPIATAGPAPNLFVLGSVAFEINTTAIFLPSPTVCVSLNPAEYPAEGKFNLLSFLHKKTAFWSIERYRAIFHPERSVPKSIRSVRLSVAEQVDPNLPSISGVVVDSNGQPMRDIPVIAVWRCDSEACTDIDGYFRFVNLTPGIEPSCRTSPVGLFVQSSIREFPEIFKQSIRVHLPQRPPISLLAELSGTKLGCLLPESKSDWPAVEHLEIETDAEGNYAFADLPANGSFESLPVDNDFQFYSSRILFQ